MGSDKPMHPLDERRRLPPCEWGRIALLALLLRVVVERTLAAILLFGPSREVPRGQRRHLCGVEPLSLRRLEVSSQTTISVGR